MAESRQSVLPVSRPTGSNELSKFKRGNYYGKSREALINGAKGAQFQPGKSGNVGGPKPGQLQKWTLPVLAKLAKHHPEAIKRIGQIVHNSEHKDHFAACKFVCETLIRDSYSKYSTPDRGEIVIRIEMADKAHEAKPVILDAETVQIAAREVLGETHDEEAQEATQG